MKLLKLFFLALFTLFTFASAFAQLNNQEVADELYSKHAYYSAIKYFNKIVSQDTVNGCSNRRKIAICYEKLHELKDAERTYRLLLSDCRTNNDDLRRFAKVLQGLGEYEKAKKIYAGCYQNDPEDKFSLESMQFCDTVKKSFDGITNVYLENQLKFNSSFDDVVDGVVNDTVYFLSSRRSGNKKSYYNGQFEYLRYKCHTTGYKKPKHEGLQIQGFSTTDLECKDFYYSDTVLLTQPALRARSIIYRIRNINGADEKTTFLFDDGISNYSHPCISQNGIMFFFISDMEGGYGGTDIYYCIKTGSKWSEPINAGSGVNTSGNELFPFYVGEGILIFASDGKPGFGGFDLYATTYSDNEWKKVKNLGYPINSRSNDMALKWDRLKKTFYLSSDRIGGKGALDIYKLFNFDAMHLKSLF